MTPGKKYDQDKAPVVQGNFNYFPNALIAVALISKYGAEKYNVPYSDRNFAKVDNAVNRYLDAQGRHTLGEAIDGFWDPESEFLHAAHTAWNALARLEMLLTKEKLPLRKPKEEVDQHTVETSNPLNEAPFAMPPGTFSTPIVCGPPTPIGELLRNRKSGDELFQERLKTLNDYGTDDVPKDGTDG